MSLKTLIREYDFADHLSAYKWRYIFILLTPFVVLGGLYEIKQFFADSQNPLASVSSAATSKGTQDLLQKLIEFRLETAKIRNDLQARLVSAQNESTSINHREVNDPKPKPHKPGPVSLTSIAPIGYDPGQGFKNISHKKKDVYIPTGAVFQAILMTPIKTSIQETFVMAKTTHEFRMDSIRKIPLGSKLIGTAQLNPLLKGVVVRFNKLVSPKGLEYNLNSLALSKDAFPELEGIYFSDDLEKYSTAMAFGFLSGFANAAQDRESSFFGPVPKTTVGNQVLNGLSTASFQVAQSMLDDIRNRAVEYVVIPAGEKIFVALQSRFNLDPEKGIEN